NQEMVDELGFAGCLRGFGKSFLPCKHIDQGRFAYIGATDKRIFRQNRRWQFVDPCITALKFGAVYDHPRKGRILEAMFKAGGVNCFGLWAMSYGLWASIRRDRSKD